MNQLGVGLLEDAEALEKELESEFQEHYAELDEPEARKWASNRC